jgi:Cleft lip and palate transmembrane protein 1 (CLPTM1)
MRVVGMLAAVVVGVVAAVSGGARAEGGEGGQNGTGSSLLETLVQMQQGAAVPETHTHRDTAEWHRLRRQRFDRVPQGKMLVPAWESGEDIRFDLWVFLSAERTRGNLSVSPEPSWFASDEDALSTGHAVVTEDVSRLKEGLDETVNLAQKSYIAQFFSAVPRAFGWLLGTGNETRGEEGGKKAEGEAAAGPELVPWEELEERRDARTPTLLWHVKGLRFKAGEKVDGVFRANVSLPSWVREQNETLYLHVVASRVLPGARRDLVPGAENRDWASYAHTVYPLMKYIKRRPKRKLRKLLESESAEQGDNAEGEAGEEEGEMEVEVGADGGVHVGSGKGGHQHHAEEEEERDLTLRDALWRPELTLSMVHDLPTMQKGAMVPPPFPDFMDVAARSSGPQQYHRVRPVLWVNDFWLLQSRMVRVNATTTTVPLSLRFETVQLLYFSSLNQMENTLRSQEAMGMGSRRDDESDSVKRILLEANPVLLAVTLVVSLLHAVFEFLAFRNDVAFWRSAKSMEGLSLQSLSVNLFFSVVIFLYLLDNETSWMILIQQVIGIAIEVWKLRKAVGLAFAMRPASSPPAPGETGIVRLANRAIAFIALGFLRPSLAHPPPPNNAPRPADGPANGPANGPADNPDNVLATTQVPYIVWADQASYIASGTREYDKIAMAHLLYAALPLLVGYSAYSLIHNLHKSF